MHKKRGFVLSLHSSAFVTRTSRGVKAEYLFIALQTQIFCIRVANADELGFILQTQNFVC